MPTILSLLCSGQLIARQDLRSDRDPFADSMANVGPSWYDKRNDSAIWPGTPPNQVAASAGRESIATTPMQKAAPAARSGMNLDWLGPWTTWLMLGLLILLLTVMVIWIVGRSRPDSKFSGRLSTETDDRNRIEQLPFEMDRTIRDFRAAALAAAREGNYRQAIIFLYSHTLVMLDQRDLIQLRKGKTNRQYLSEVLNSIPRDGGFRSLIQDFEAVFFGNYPALEKDFDRVLGCTDNIGNVALQSDPGGRR